MTITSRPILGLTVLGAILVASSLSANALTVGRCNALVDGVYVPVLVVRNGDAESVHQIGTDGLTRRIVFDADAALTWAADLFGATDSDYSDACHKVENDSIAPPPPVVIPDPVDEDEDDYGGEGDGNDVLL